MRSQLIFALLLLVQIASLFVLGVRGDTPAHCEFPQIKGRWTFEVVSGFDKTAPYNQCKMMSPLPNGPKELLQVQLDGPNIVRDPSTQQEIGSWTLIYDQGFELNLPNPKMQQQCAGSDAKAGCGTNVLFAFFNYTMNGSTVKSNCDKTFTGWMHMRGVNIEDGWSCVRGYHTFSGSEGSNAENAVPATHTYNLEQDVYRIKDKKRHEQYRSHPELIRTINTAQSLWIAEEYPWLNSMTRAQVNRMAGSVLPEFRIRARQQHKQMMQTMYPRVQNGRNGVAATAIPAFFDWRNVTGVNYVSPVRNQASCGSCYAFASTSAFNDRARVASGNKLQPIFSPQDVVDCSQYSQGCNGGFAYLISKFGQDYGLVEESCVPYVAHEQQCASFGKSCKRTFIKSYGYIGGYYGATTVEDMQLEIMANGPIPVSIMVYEDFMKYKGGIYIHVKASEKLSSTGPDPHFEITNHVVEIVGWGEEHGTPYWIVKNSWSEKWGEQGYFRIRRGTDEIAIESEVIQAQLQL